MSVFRDMANDGGYRGDEAEQVARQLEEHAREEQEPERCCAPDCGCAPMGAYCPMFGTTRAGIED